MRNAAFEGRGPITCSDGGVGRLIWEGARSGRDGELRLRRDGVLGRVFLVNGRVAWAHTNGRHGTLVDRLVERDGLSRPELAELVRRCKSDGTNFGERLVAMGGIGPTRLRDALRDHIRTQLDAVRTAHGPLTALFVPGTRAYAGRFTFTADEIAHCDVGPDSAMEAALRWVHALWDRAVRQFPQPLAVGVRERDRVPYLTRLAEHLGSSERADVERLIERRAVGTNDLEHHLSWGAGGLVYYECPVPGSGRRALLAARDVTPGLMAARGGRLVAETAWPD